MFTRAEIRQSTTLVLERDDDDDEVQMSKVEVNEEEEEKVPKSFSRRVTGFSHKPLREPSFQYYWMQRTITCMAVKRFIDGRCADFQWALGLNRLSLRMIGVWPEANHDQRHEVSWLRSMRVPFMMLWLVLAIVLPQTYALAQVYRHLDLVVDNLITNSAALTSVIKLFLLWKNRYGEPRDSYNKCAVIFLGQPMSTRVILTVLEPAIRATEDDWSSVNGNRETTTRHQLELESMTRQANRARIFTVSGYVIMFGCFAGFVFTPLFGIGIRVVNNITDPLDGRFFPLQTYYPYDIASFPLYELTYASQLLAGSFVGIAFSVPDNFFGALVFHACAQCEILNARLREIEQIGDYCSMDLVEREGERFHRHLRDFVRRHVQIIRGQDRSRQGLADHLHGSDGADRIRRARARRAPQGAGQFHPDHRQHLHQRAEFGRPRSVGDFAKQSRSARQNFEGGQVRLAARQTGPRARHHAQAGAQRPPLHHDQLRDAVLERRVGRRGHARLRPVLSPDQQRHGSAPEPPVPRAEPVPGQGLRDAVLSAYVDGAHARLAGRLLLLLHVQQLFRRRRFSRERPVRDSRFECQRDRARTGLFSTASPGLRQRSRATH
ncbi:unnamed protein product [Trichogramma brassicae]|uniref:Odorant receptor n=1 Tax=Trichogramma brassicae TaxID=86971 RepID=A0A6H5ICM1_9HYME|nr:unnamed protein product [Trichogramma brassicae]